MQNRSLLLNWIVIGLSAGFIVWCVNLILTVSGKQDQIKTNVIWIGQLMRIERSLQNESNQLIVSERVDLGAGWLDSLGSVQENTNSMINLMKADAGDPQSMRSCLAALQAYTHVSAVSSDQLTRATPRQVPLYVNNLLAENEKAFTVAHAGVVELRKSNGQISVELQSKWAQINILALISCVLAFVSSLLFVLNSRRKVEIQKTKVQANQAKFMTNFMATINHEIRTPLNAVIGLSELLLQDNPKARQISNLNTLRFSARHLLRLINDTLDLNKVDSGKLVLVNRDFDLHALLDNLEVQHEVEAKQKGLTLQVKVGEKVPEMVQGDELRLTQILTNLLGNATKFTREGKVSLSVDLLKEEGQEAWLHFTVSDTGVGISEDQLPRIFDRYTQANHDTSYQFGGTGLGLTITEKLLELFHSSLQVESRSGEGSNFSFDLKLTKSVRPVKPDTGKTIADLEGIFGYRMLVVEDNKVNQLVVGQMLRKFGAEVHYAIDGEVALSRIAAETFDLVLMDMQMPVMDGYEATKAIRQHPDPFKRQLPIIAVTASNLEETRKKAFDAGVSDFLTKPFTPDELLTVVSRHLPTTSPAQEGITS